MSDADTDDDEVDADAADVETDDDDVDAGDVTGFAVRVSIAVVTCEAATVLLGTAPAARVLTTALVLSVASAVERTAAGGCA